MGAAVKHWARQGAASVPHRHLDRAAYEETSGFVGHERMKNMLVMLADELDPRFGPASATQPRERITEDAHAMIFATSMIGFPAMADACRAVEEACMSKGDYGRPFVSRRALAAEAIVEIAALGSG